MDQGEGRFIINSKDKGLFVHCTIASQDPEIYNPRAPNKELEIQSSSDPTLILH